MEVIMNYEMFDGNKQGEGHGAGQKVMGVFLIVVGVLVILGMNGISFFGFSPWILMAFLPVVWIGSAAYRLYKVDGRLSGRVLLTLGSALLPFVFIGAIMLGVNVGSLWPVFIIIGGACFLLSGK
jgi:hypothetical protein